MLAIDHLVKIYFRGIMGNKPLQWVKERVERGEMNTVNTDNIFKSFLKVDIK